MSIAQAGNNNDIILAFWRSTYLDERNIPPPSAAVLSTDRAAESIAKKLIRGQCGRFGRKPKTRVVNEPRRLQQTER